MRGTTDLTSLTKARGAKFVATNQNAFNAWVEIAYHLAQKWLTEKYTYGSFEDPLTLANKREAIAVLEKPSEDLTQDLPRTKPRNISLTGIEEEKKALRESAYDAFICGFDRTLDVTTYRYDLISFNLKTLIDSIHLCLLKTAKEFCITFSYTGEHQEIHTLIKEAEEKAAADQVTELQAQIPHPEAQAVSTDKYTRQDEKIHAAINGTEATVLTPDQTSAPAQTAVRETVIEPPKVVPATIVPMTKPQQPIDTPAPAPQTLPVPPIQSNALDQFRQKHQALLLADQRGLFGFFRRTYVKGNTIQTLEDVFKHVWGGNRKNGWSGERSKRALVELNWFDNLGHLSPQAPVEVKDAYETWSSKRARPYIDAIMKL